MKKRKGKPAGMNYADVLERKRLIRQAVQDEVILHEVNISMQRHLWLTAVALHKSDHWTYEEYQKAVAMRKRGYLFKEIGAALGKSNHAVQNKFAREGY